MSVYEQIGSCEYVLSSSLHGLIISDSFGIPNLHIKVTNNMRGDGFKFEDYYSGFGLTDKVFNLRETDIMPTINDIIDFYCIDRRQVEQKQEEMLACFPY